MPIFFIFLSFVEWLLILSLLWVSDPIANFSLPPFWVPSLRMRRDGGSESLTGGYFQASGWQSVSYSTRAKLENVPSLASCCQHCSGGSYLSCWLQECLINPNALATSAPMLVHCIFSPLGTNLSPHWSSGLWYHQQMFRLCCRK